MAKNPFKPDTGAKSEFIDVKKSAGILDDFAVRKVAHSRELYGQTADFTDTVTIQQNTAGFEALRLKRSDSNYLAISVPSGTVQTAKLEANGSNIGLQVVTATNSPFGIGDLIFSSDGDINPSDTVPFLWDYSTGRVGIQESAPEAYLHVTSTTGETAIFDYVNGAANVDKAIQLKESGTTNLYLGNYYGYHGIVNPVDNGTLFFGIATDALAIQAYFLMIDDDLIIDAATLQLGSSLTNPSTRIYCSALGFYGTAPATQWNQSGTIGALTTGGSGNKLDWDDDVVDGNLGGTEYSIQDIVAALKLIGILAP